MTAVATGAATGAVTLTGLRLRPAITAAGLGLAAGLVYLVVGPAKVHDAFGSLAEAFRAGRLVVPDGSSMELVPRGDGWSYVPFPPVPALPMVATQALGLEATDATLTAMAGGVAVGLAYLLLRGMRVAEATALAGTGALASGILWMAATGGTWLYAQVLAVALSLAALNLAVRGRWPLVAGLLLGLAAGSRLPAGLALPLVVYLYRGSWAVWWRLAAGLALVALPLAAYNLARFGSPVEFGYGQIASFYVSEASVQAESWYADGVVSLSYVPRSLGAMLLSGFDVVTEAPWLRPDHSGLSVAIVAPAFLLALSGWRTRLGAVAIAAAVLVMLPNWAHGNWGFYQYGYRFLADAMPALLVALGVAYRVRPTPALWGAVALSAAANLYGLWAIGSGFVTGPTT